MPRSVLRNAMSTHPAPAVIVALGTSSLSCADPRLSGDDSWSVSDSAGVTIVGNHGEAARVPVWEARTELTIGQVHGADEYTFGEIADVEVDARGRFLVLDRQARRARVYSREGHYLHDVGGPGEGPGELSNQPTRIAVGPHDWIYIMDLRQLRLNVYQADGGAARSVPFRLGRPGPYDFQLVGDRALLLRWFRYDVDDDGRFVPWDALLLQDSVAPLDTVLVFDYRPPDLGHAGGDLRRPLIVNTAFYDVLSDGRIAWSALEHRQVAVHALDGTPAMFVRNTQWVRHATSAAEQAALEAAYRVQADRPDGPLPDNVVFPDSLPAITALRAAPHGGFWVQRMGHASEIDPQALFVPANSVWLGGRTWEVYDAEGRLQSHAQMPPRFRVTRVLASSVVGVQRDELGVERVVRIRVIR